MKKFDFLLYFMVVQFTLGRASEIKFVIKGTVCGNGEQTLTGNEDVWLKIKFKYIINKVWCDPSYGPGENLTIGTLIKSDFKLYERSYIKIYKSKKNIPFRTLKDGIWKCKICFLENTPLPGFTLRPYSNGNSYNELECKIKVRIEDDSPDILLKFNEKNECQSHQIKYDFKENDKIFIKTDPNYINVNKVRCSLNQQEPIGAQLFQAKNFESKCRPSNTSVPTKTEANVTQSMHGNWECTFSGYSLDSRGISLDSKPINCKFRINVTKSDTGGSNGLSSSAIVAIAVCTAFIVGGIIIAQTLALCHFKAKADAKPNLEEIPLEMRRDFERKPRVYSELPWKKPIKIVHKLQEDDARSGSQIYEDVSPVMSIKNRPPMPLPEVYEDPQSVLGDRRDKGPELPAASPPEPPNIDTLPRAKAKKQKFCEE